MLNTCHGDLICSIVQRYEIVGTKEEFQSLLQRWHWKPKSENTNLDNNNQEN